MKLVYSLLISFYVLSNVQGQTIDSTYLKENFDKAEYFIEMRDGIKLYTLVYSPKAEGDYPILLKRTCYNASRSDNFQFGSQPSTALIKEGYIFAFQDVRGRYMSEGKFDNMRPNVNGNDLNNKKAIDESSDTYDSIDWMVKNIKNNNGKVGMYGVSYPGFYTAAALPDAHPALKASSPQAPISDFYFDDFHHHGAFLQSYTPAFAVFGYQKDTLTRSPWYMDKMMRFYSQKIADGYDFYLEKGPLKNITEEFHHDNFFWNQIVEHPNYDEFWQKRSLLPALTGGDIDHAVMTVGGWYDAEDLCGPLNIYKTVEKHNPKAKNTIVMGPWTHGGWARERGQQTVNHIYFGDSISSYYQNEIEAPFFAHHLKDQEANPLPEAIMFDTGKKEWKKFEAWPPENITPTELYFGEKGKLYVNAPTDPQLEFEYTSDPAKPVPYRSVTEGLTFTPRQFITDDQREAGRRPDVVTFCTDVLEEDVTIAGEILANLVVSMTGTDADFVVKLIDKYPPDHPEYEHNPKNIKMGNYEQLVRHEVFRGRYRDSYSNPKPFVPGQKTEVSVPLQDILHTFKKGHRIMIQVHSTWFPYIDRNPQKYVDNIYKAEEEDFIKSDIIVYGASTVKAGGAAVTNKREIRP
ncbi:MAG: CocE/NonD family hydrolase [Saprospiraceae bacterium]|nr:CocE/NonD family hydrolase [Saprospiraceae bacterium]